MLDIATDEGEVDYWKSEAIAFVVEFCFQCSSVVDFKVSILFFAIFRPFFGPK
jgi:hypothetical protein